MYLTTTTTTETTATAGTTAPHEKTGGWSLGRSPPFEVHSRLHEDVSVEEPVTGWHHHLEQKEVEAQKAGTKNLDWVNPRSSNGV